MKAYKGFHKSTTVKPSSRTCGTRSATERS